MKSILPFLPLLCLLLLLGLTIFLASGQAPRSLPTVSFVNLESYAGAWSEIARLPNPFQRDDARATAEYTLLPDGTVRVLNTELRPEGPTRRVEGRATVVPDSGNARLRVRFGGLAALVPVPTEGNYWIIDLEPDYSAALIGTPDRKFLWLLARSYDLSASIRDRLLHRAGTLGFPVEKLIFAGSERPSISAKR